MNVKDLGARDDEIRLFAAKNDPISSLAVEMVLAGRFGHQASPLCGVTILRDAPTVPSSLTGRPLPVAIRNPLASSNRCTRPGTKALGALAAALSILSRRSADDCACRSEGGSSTTANFS